MAALRTMPTQLGWMLGWMLVWTTSRQTDHPPFSLAAHPPISLSQSYLSPLPRSRIRCGLPSLRRYPSEPHAMVCAQEAWLERCIDACALDNQEAVCFDEEG